MKKLATSTKHVLGWALVPVVVLGSLAFGFIHLFLDGAKQVMGVKK